MRQLLAMVRDILLLIFVFAFVIVSVVCILAACYILPCAVLHWILQWILHA